jgi:hypothetical protein
MKSACTSDNKATTKHADACGTAESSFAYTQRAEGGSLQPDASRYIHFMREKEEYIQYLKRLFAGSSLLKSACEGRCGLMSSACALLDYVPMLARMLRNEAWLYALLGECDEHGETGSSVAIRSSRRASSSTRFEYTSQRTRLDDSSLTRLMYLGSVGRHRRQNLVPSNDLHP